LPFTYFYASLLVCSRAHARDCVASAHYRDYALWLTGKTNINRVYKKITN